MQHENKTCLEQLEGTFFTLALRLAVYLLLVFVRRWAKHVPG